MDRWQCHRHRNERRIRYRACYIHPVKTLIGRSDRCVHCSISTRAVTKPGPPISKIYHMAEASTSYTGASPSVQVYGRVRRRYESRKSTPGFCTTLFSLRTEVKKRGRGNGRRLMSRLLIFCCALGVLHCQRILAFSVPLPNYQDGTDRRENLMRTKNVDVLLA